MKTESIFAFGSYKQILADRLSGPKCRGLLSRAAEALNCQRSYLSRVINAELHLTPDHAFRLTEFLDLQNEERDYFLTLVEFERAGDSSYRHFLDERLKRVRRAHNSLQKRVRREDVVKSNIPSEYFTSWAWSAIHFLTAIPKFQEPLAIAERLGLKKSLVTGILTKLAEMGFVERHQHRWRYRSGEFHLPPNSPLVILHHQNWRQRALLDSQINDENSIHFTAVHTISAEHIEKLRELLRKFIAEASALAAPSPAEEAYALNCDLFVI